MNNILKKFIENNNKKNCCEEFNFSTIKLKDARGESIALSVGNSKRQKIYKIQVDDCLIDDNTKKCDLIVCLSANNNVALIELKGKNLNNQKWKDIGEQFLQTINTINLEHQDCICVLVSFRNNPKANTKKQQITKKIKDKGSLLNT